MNQSTASGIYALLAERDALKASVEEWHALGEVIMEAVCGRKAPLSDSDVIGEVERLRARVAQLAKALLSVSHKRQFGLCWCNTVAGLYCVGQDQCRAASAALEGRS